MAWRLHRTTQLWRAVQATWKVPWLADFAMQAGDAAAHTLRPRAQRAVKFGKTTADSHADLEMNPPFGEAVVIVRRSARAYDRPRRTCAIASPSIPQLFNVHSLLAPLDAALRRSRSLSAQGLVDPRGNTVSKSDILRCVKYVLEMSGDAEGGARVDAQSLGQHSERGTAALL